MNVQELPLGELETSSSFLFHCRLSEISATDPRGSGGSDGSGGSGGSAIEHGNTLESVHSHRLCCHVKNYLSKPSLSKVFHTIIRSLDCNLLKAPFVSTVSMPRLLSPLVWTATPPHRESRRLKGENESCSLLLVPVAPLPLRIQVKCPFNWTGIVHEISQRRFRAFLIQYLFCSGLVMSDGNGASNHRAMNR